MQYIVRRRLREAALVSDPRQLAEQLGLLVAARAPINYRNAAGRFNVYIIDGGIMESALTASKFRIYLGPDHKKTLVLVQNKMMVSAGAEYHWTFLSAGDGTFYIGPTDYDLFNPAYITPDSDGTAMMGSYDQPPRKGRLLYQSNTAPYQVIARAEDPRSTLYLIDDTHLAFREGVATGFIVVQG